ncbi:MAG: hypothetical protein JKY18_02525 [Flavobacteriales bacterium]|nr:hypothetical protein [Flavobacteriales bacterium]MBL4734212.1 hypothetical protein [Flavobacteriales bacterium]
MKKNNNNKAIAAQGAKVVAKTKSNESIFSFAILVFSMIGMSTVLQLVFLA